MGKAHATPGVDVDVLDGIETFIEKVVRPLEEGFSQELETTGTIDPGQQLQARRALRRRSADAGFYSAAMPEEVGGGGVDPLTIAYAYRVIGASGLLLADRGGVLPNVEGPQVQMTAMNEQQRETYLTPLLNAEIEGCFAITEPDAGSDATRIRTTAREDGDYWIINGSKQFITHGAHADFVQVIAETDPSATPSRRHTAFLVDRGTPGFSVGRTHHTLGEDRPVDLHFDNVRVPASAIVGRRGNAIKYGLAGIGRARVNIAALAIGKSEYLLSRMVTYANQRQAFGKPIGAFQHVQAHIVESSIEIEAAIGILQRAAHLADSDSIEARRLAATAKIFATESLSRTADRAIQVLGGVGVTHAGGVERYYRDARAMRIYDGTSELLRSNIAGWLGLPR